MKVLTLIAHPNPNSFSHAVLDNFTRGLKDAGHECEVADLYAIKFNPVFHTEDFASYVHESMPADILEKMTPSAVAKLIHSKRPKNVIAHQEIITSGGLCSWQGVCMNFY
jgi:NAD(P)H dehydrogenase (quinone)